MEISSMSNPSQELSDPTSELLSWQEILNSILKAIQNQESLSPTPKGLIS
ncbi:13786_t:CDS:1, partial [Dentiscutata erythropus]